MRLRNSSWSEVSTCITAKDASRNAAGWANRYGLPTDNYQNLPVTLECWSNERIASELVKMAEAEPRLLIEIVGGINNATIPPRCDGLPIIVIRFGEKFGMIDGKHRANKWKHIPGNYAVLVIESAQC